MLFRKKQIVQLTQLDLAPQTVLEQHTEVIERSLLSLGDRRTMLEREIEALQTELAQVKLALRAHEAAEKIIKAEQLTFEGVI